MKESIYDNMTRSERIVADLLKEMGIKWRYEQPVFVWDENKRPRVWAPDFYLISLGVYIEVCGSSAFDYEYRKKVFDANGHQVIFLHLYKKSDKWVFHLIKSLRIFINKRDLRLNDILQSIRIK